MLNKERLATAFLRSAADDTTYRSVLRALGEAVRAAHRRAEDAVSGSADWAEIVSDAQNEVVEDLLGTAYVVCQTQITAVTNRALSARAILQAGGRTVAFGSGKKDVRGVGARLSATIATPTVELLWALANYFKHREDWGVDDWSGLNGQSKSTVEVLALVGIGPGGTGNLRTGAEALGNDRYHELDVFADAVDAWAGTVLHALGSS